MSEYKKVFEGFLNDNAEGVAKNPKAPKYRSGGGKNAIRVTEDIPKGTVIYLAAWGGKGEYGPYIRMTGQVQASEKPVQKPVPAGGGGFDDDIPFAQFEKGTVV